MGRLTSSIMRLYIGIEGSFYDSNEDCKNLVSTTKCNLKQGTREQDPDTQGGDIVNSKVPRSKVTLFGFEFMLQRIGA